jgi:KUP system potassium uptake protein
VAVAALPLMAMRQGLRDLAASAAISGACLLTREAVQVDPFPRSLIAQTSSEETGQVYVPAVNVSPAGCGQYPADAAGGSFR